MRILKVAALSAILVFGVSLAQEVEQTVAVKLEVVENGGEPREVHWVSDGMDFELEDLDVGETRTLTGDDGETVTVTRTEQGMEFLVDGETVVLPDFGAHGEHLAFVDGDFDVEVHALDGAHENVDVTVVGPGTHAIRAFPPDGVTIISSEPLDDSVRESIRSVLISAGHDVEVTFVDRSADQRHIKVIRRVETL